MNEYDWLIGELEVRRKKRFRFYMIRALIIILLAAVLVNRYLDHADRLDNRRDDCQDECIGQKMFHQCVRECMNK